MFRKEIPYFEILPKGYGVAYRLPDRDVRVAYPIPINVFVSIGRDIYYCFARPFSFMDKILDSLRDPVVVGVLFAILNTPQVTQLLIRFLPMVGNNFMYNLGFRALVAMILFGLIKFFL